MKGKWKLEFSTEERYKASCAAGPSAHNEVAGRIEYVLVDC